MTDVNIRKVTHQEPALARCRRTIWGSVMVALDRLSVITTDFEIACRDRDKIGAWLRITSFLSSEFIDTLASLWGFNLSHLICMASRIWHHGGGLFSGQPWRKAIAELAKINIVQAKPLAPGRIPAQSQGPKAVRRGPMPSQIIRSSTPHPYY